MRLKFPVFGAKKGTYFWALPSGNRFIRSSVPTTLPWSVPGISVSLSTSPCLASAMDTRLTSRVRPTARSYAALASRRLANARNSAPWALTRSLGVKSLLLELSLFTSGFDLDTALLQRDECIADVHHRSILKLLHLRFDLPQLQDRALVGSLRRAVAKRNLHVHTNQVVRKLVLEHLALCGRESLLGDCRRPSRSRTRYGGNAGESLAGVLGEQGGSRPQGDPGCARIDPRVRDVDLLLE